MPGFSVQVEGLAELKAKLDQLARPAARRIGNRALRAGAVVLKEEIELRTPVRHDSPSGTALPPGALQHDIQIKTIPAPDQVSSYLAVGPGRLTAHVMRWLEYGHRLVRNGKDAGFVPAYPIMRPAEMSAQDGVIDAVKESLKRDLLNVNNGNIPEGD